MTTDHAVDIDKQVRIYIIVFVALMVLTVITVGDLSLPPAVPIAVTVALLIAIDQGVAGRVLLHAPDPREEADLRGPRADRCLLRRAAGPARPDRPQRLLDSRMNLRLVHAVLILISAALAVLFGVWCLGAVWARATGPQPARGRRGRSRVSAAWSSTTRGSCARRGRCDEAAADAAGAARWSSSTAVLVTIGGGTSLARLPGVLRRRGDRR